MKYTHNNLEFELVKGLPEDYGVYFFLLENHSIKEGLYDSFPFPHNRYDIKITDYELEDFYYEKVIGWFKLKNRQ